MVRPGRDMLSGDVEVDDTSIGWVKPGKRGRGRTAGKTLVAVAVERTGAKGFGRSRLQVIPDATAPTLGQSLADHAKSGANQPAHRRTQVLPDRRRCELRSQARQPCRHGSTRPSAASRRAPHRLTGEALAGFHPPGRGRGRPSVGVPRRSPSASTVAMLAAESSSFGGSSSSQSIPARAPMHSSW